MKHEEIIQLHHDRVTAVVAFRKMNSFLAWHECNDIVKNILNIRWLL